MNRELAGKGRVQSWGAGVAVTLVSTALLVAGMAPVQERIGLLNEGLLLLLLTLVISTVYGWRIGLLAALVTNLALNFFFVPPLHTFSVREPENIVALGVFLVVSIVGGSLLTMARSAAAESLTRQAETEVLLRMSRAMIGQANATEALRLLCRELIAAFEAPGAAVLSRQGSAWAVLVFAGAQSAARAVDASEGVLVESAVASSGVRRFGHTGFSRSRRVRIIKPSGPRRFEQPSTGSIVSPLSIGDRVLGVLRLDGPIGATPFRERPEQLLDAFANEAALAVHRVELMQAVAHADALRQADELKTALMTSISHDLKTPLAAIKASVSSLLDAAVTWSADDRRAFLETIDSQADRLDRVISDILDLNRLQAGAIAPALVPISARTILHEVREATRPVAVNRNVRIDVDGDVAAMADEVLLHQSLVNLVENAAKYSDPAGAIVLTAVNRGDCVEFAVEDEGPGIAREDLLRVFDRFFRGSAHGRQVRGTGLGLAIVKGFVELCEGGVRYEGGVRGARFVVTLPAAVKRPALA